MPHMESRLPDPTGHNSSHLQQLGINIDHLEAELDAAVAKDARYWLENDTKIRAVQQGVPTYEHFRQLVAGCHLRPLARTELALDKQLKHGWNPPAAALGYAAVASVHDDIDTTNLQRAVSPQKFYARWQSLRPTDDGLDLLTVKARFALNQPPELLKALFDCGLGVCLLHEFLQSLLHLINQTPVSSEQPDPLSQALVDVLFAVTQSSQFDMALQLLSESERIAATELIDHLISRLGPCSSVHSHIPLIKRSFQQE